MPEESVPGILLSLHLRASFCGTVSSMEMGKKTKANQAVLSLSNLPKHVEGEGSYMLLWQAYKLEDVTSRQTN